MLDKRTIRNSMRQMRRQLPEYQQKQLALDLEKQLFSLRWVRFARHIASYITNDGELSTMPINRHIITHKKQCCYLPVIDPGGDNTLTFHIYSYKSSTYKNRFGITEPVHERQAHKPLFTLDVILMPLVAFDSKGNRLGMGAGYYDKTLGFYNSFPGLPKPRLIGLAYDFQRVDALPCDPWDMPLDAVCTPQTTWLF